MVALNRMNLSILIILTVNCKYIIYGLSPSVPSNAISNNNNNNNNNHKYYKYFAIGSNMNPCTMTSLRNLVPISATAAILPNYELCFNIPGNIFIEPSAASVRPIIHNNNNNNKNNNNVHGVLYTLTSDDFATLGQSEGVPLIYQWERCYPIPYIGNNNNAGEIALQQVISRNNQEIFVENDNDSKKMNHTDPYELDEAYVLIASKLETNIRSCTATQRQQQEQNDQEILFIPPSRSYLQILQDGSQYWNMDISYQNYLQNNITMNPNIPGISNVILNIAIQQNPKPSIKPQSY